MIREIINAYLRRQGRKQAEREINLIEHQVHSSSDYSEFNDKYYTEINPRMKGSRSSSSRNYHYRLAWEGRWFDEGYRDAKHGKNRAEKFNNKNYEYGWIESVKHLKECGYNNPSFQFQYKYLVRKNFCADIWRQYGVDEDP